MLKNLQTMLFDSSSSYCTDFDHSYSSTMSASNAGGSTRTPRRGAATNPTIANNNTATFSDDSDRSASSSTNTTTGAGAGAALANGINATLPSVGIVSTNSNILTAVAKPAGITAQQQVSSLDRGNSIQELKKSLTLDFTNPESAKKSLQTQTPELLSFLRLTSPELEKFLTQGFTQGVSVVQTPTPTQFFFPKNVTTEQEQYARGFLDALNQIYQHKGHIPVNNILSPGFVVNTVAQEAKEGGNKDSGSTSSSATSVFPGPSTSNVNFNSNFQLVSNFLAAISTPTLPNSAVPEPALITTVSSTSGAQQIRQTLAAAAATIGNSSSTAFYAFNPRGQISNNVLPNISSSSTSIVVNDSVKSEPDERCTPSPNTYESRSSSVGSSYRGDHSNFGAGSDAAAAVALAAMNRNGGHSYSAHHFQTGNSGASYMQPNQHQFLALTNAAQLLIGGGHQQQLDHHNLSSTASASSTASSVSGASTKMEMSDEQSLPGSGRSFLPGTMPLNPQEQEKLKLERKRARNRQAATKCRKRKIERIQTLEGEVGQLEEFNRSLEDRRDVLLEELHELRKLIEEHQRAKCNIIVPQSSIASSSSVFSNSLLNGTK